MLKRLKKIKNISFFKKYPKAFNILILLAIFAFLPLLVFALQQRQEIRQRAAQQSITISFDPSENYGQLTMGIGLKIPTSIDNETFNNIVKTFPNGGIYLELADPANSILESNNFKSLYSKGFKWYFSFSDQNDNNAIPFLQSFFQQFNGNIVVQIKNYNNVTLINNIHNQFPGVKIQSGNIRGADRDNIRKIFSQTPPPTTDAIGYETLGGGSDVYNDFKLMFDTLYDITTDRVEAQKINYPSNASFSISDVPVGFSDNQQAISYITGITSTAVVTSIQASKAQNTAPIKYFILGNFSNDDNLKNALIIKFLNDFIKNQAVLVWPWAIIENGDMYWNDYFPEKSKSKPIVGIIGKNGNEYYSLLTNMSGNSVAVNFTADMNFSAYKFYSSQKGMGNFASSNQLSFAPYETILISKSLDGNAVSPSPTTTIPTRTPPVSIKNGDLNSFPKPKNNTGLGLHWADGGSYIDGESAKKSVCELKKTGFSWIKLVSGNNTAMLDFARIMKLNDIEPIVRLYRERPNGSSERIDLNAVSEYIKAGVTYIEPNNEPNLHVEWQGGKIPNCNNSNPLDSCSSDLCKNAAFITMDSWTKEAVEIQKKGGIPIFPALAPGGNCNDIEFLNNSFEWLKSNNCNLANGQTENCLGVFDSNKSNGKPAVIGIHNYSLTYGNDDQRGFKSFEQYHNKIRDYLSYEIPILGTEDGITWGSDTTSSDEHKNKINFIANYQKNNTTAYFFNTAFWLALSTGGWSKASWYSMKSSTLEPILTPTIDELKKLRDYQGSCAVITPTPKATSPTSSPTKSPSPTTSSQISPTSGYKTPSPTTKISPTSTPKKSLKDYIPFACPTIPGLGLQLGCFLFASPTPK